MENVNINEKHKLIELRKQNLIMKQNIYKLLLKKYGLHLHCPLWIPLHMCINN